ncbi:MAG: ABC-F family ATP-binding cassette domain-containing protein [Myxococcaceae bacterium]|nr:ABC-F family ATP-binding cassette domain-containing protein [Myxococcaceae bacterium]MBH2006013.1 ABC-F family ATP-binding cassette domain-containing protein [Myxococcaceae bacterium]
MLSAREIVASYGEKRILDRASFTLLEGERVALVGQNGSGKSTFLHILAGFLEPDSGEVVRQKGLKIGYLSQTPKLQPSDTVWEALREGFSGEDYEIESVLSQLQIVDRQATVGTLSGGQKRRVDLARVLLEDPDVFLLDEPTNHLDFEAIAYLAARLKSAPKPVLFVSHDRAFINEVATRIFELDSGKFFLHGASYENFIENKLIRTDIEARTLQKKDRLLARELVWLRAGTPARTTKQSARISRATDLIDEVDREYRRTQEKTVQIESAEARRLAKTVLELRALAFEPLFRNLNLIVTEGQRFGILGPNGVGKTTLLSLISGKLQPSSGEIVCGHHTQMVQFDQHRGQLDPAKSLKETLADEGDVVFLGTQSLHVASYLERYLFAASDSNRKVSTLSGGEQNRLLMALLMKQGANCLLLDEPTNDLDSSTLGILEEMLLEQSGVAFIVSHDRMFLDRVCNQMLVFEKDQIAHYPGNFTTYQRLRTSTKPSIVQESQVFTSSHASKIREKKKRSYHEEREYESIMALILAEEERKQVFEQTLSHSARHGEFAEATKALESSEQKIAELYERWQYLDSFL